MARLLSYLLQNIHDGFDEAGIEILSPHYRANRDGNESTIAKDNLKSKYPEYDVASRKDGAPELVPEPDEDEEPANVKAENVPTKPIVANASTEDTTNASAASTPPTSASETPSSAKSK